MQGLSYAGQMALYVLGAVLFGFLFFRGVWVGIPIVLIALLVLVAVRRMRGSRSPVERRETGAPPESSEQVKVVEPAHAPEPSTPRSEATTASRARP